MNDRQHMIALLAMLSKQTGHKLEDDRLNFYLDRLDPVGATKVCQALSKMLETATRFPTVAEIKQVAGVAEPTAQDSALLLADRICTAVAKYGEVNSDASNKGLEQALGTQAWELVKRQGGWLQCVERAGENLGVFRAQLRDTAAAYLRLNVLEPIRELPPLPSPIGLTEVGKRVLEASTPRSGASGLLAAPGRPGIQVTFCLKGDVFVESGSLAWSPLGDERPAMVAPIKRSFPDFTAASDFVRTELGESPHAAVYLQQLNRARLRLAQLRISMGGLDS